MKYSRPCRLVGLATHSRRGTAPKIAVSLATLCFASLGHSTDIQGTMSNFDVFNETNENVYGAEIDLEGLHPYEVMKTYPAHFNSYTATEYTKGAVYGTHLTFFGYNFDPSGYMIPRVGQSTNGHFAVNLPGCEHFGFSVQVQPTTTRFFWLNANQMPIGTKPLSIPNPTWTYVPPVGGVQAVMQAVVVPPPPEDFEPMLPDSIWMKLYVTELERPVDLMELISGPGSIVPQDKPEVEWSLLEGGVPELDELSIADATQAVVRRYEYFKYTGAYDPTEHSPLSTWDHVSPPPDAELGEFISANMVAANLAPVPEPTSLIVIGAGVLGLVRARKMRR
ncbi:MAG: PEP-CTERM sorting domain-containing protein [Armatimonadetes bacterium]|nr:PEP-CTERM sorting domain-containing protein [Armatimonadota bacterium]